MYKGLEPNATYTAVLQVFDKTEGKVVEGIEVVKEFTASETGEGSVMVEVTINGEEFAGHVLVMFETVYAGPTKDNKPENPDKPVGEHKNPEAPEQTIYVPKIGTVAKDKADGDKFIANKNNAKIIDTVAYEGLVPGDKYEAVLTVFDKTDNKVLPGIEVHKTFTANNDGIGPVDVMVTVDGTKLQGHVLVMFEEVFKVPSKDDKPNAPKTPVAEHKDPKDEDQTIYVPKIGTTATDIKGNKTVANGAKVELLDTIKYEGLAPGEYIVKTELAVAKTGKVIQADETKVTVKNVNGEIKVTITADTSKYGGQDLVFFETILKVDANGKPIKVAEHRNPKDPAQTVTVEKVNPPKTGDESDIALYTTILIAAIMTLIIVTAKKRRRN